LVRDDTQAPRSERCLVVFADDWGRHPSSCQHLVREMLGTCDVVWINTIGTRGLTLDADVIRRAFHKLRQWFSKRAAAPAAEPRGKSPRVFNPPMYPGFRTRWQRALNARLLANYLKKHVAHLRDAVVLSAVPITADLPAQIEARRWVYYCVDDFSAWPGLDSRPLQQMEEQLVARADRVVAAGDNLATRLEGMGGRKAEVLTHGIEVTHWTRSDGDATLLADLALPLVVFWGLIDRRLDFALLEALNSRMKEGTIVLVGPQQNPDPRIARLSRVRLTGPAAYEDLPALARKAAVLVMPYADLPVTRAMQPLKLKEYLATGRPVVASRLPSVVGWEDCMDVVDDADTFASQVLARLAAPAPAAQLQARSRLVGEGWRAKSTRFAEILFGD
jgi:glycosyltransferase involved in cell wall biosynthesis